MKNTYSKERFMSILWDLYYKTSNGNKMIGYKEFCLNHKVTNAIFPTLVKHKVLQVQKVEEGKTSTKGKKCNSYTWVSIHPNVYMAEKLMESIIKFNKEANEKHKEKLQLKKQENANHFEFCETEINETGIHIKNNNVDVTYDFVKEVDSEKEQILSSSYKVFNHLTQTYIDPNDPFYAGISNPVTLNTSPVVSEKENVPVQQQSTRKISICWGLIYIQW
jgi:hypothetical protein